MSTTLDRLRRLQGLRSRRTVSEPPAPRPPTAPQAGPPAAGQARAAAPIEELEPGRLIETGAGQCYLVSRRYPLTAAIGGMQIGSVLDHAPATLASLYPNYQLHNCHDFQNVVFLDTETTGLGGGAGVYAFMVGIGTFEVPESPGHNDCSSLDFVVRQFFMRHPGEEAALLTGLADALADRTCLVTFNGRSFDAPLLRGRFRYAQRILPEEVAVPALLEEAKPHLDLLHPARRLWKRRLASCALSNLERAILGHFRTEADVSGSLIPQMYTDYLQSGDGQEMQRVFYHNREDIVSMAVLAAVICAAFSGTDRGQPGDLHGEDLLSRARLHLEMNSLETAEGFFREALERIATGTDLAETFDGLGRLLKRQERWDEAAAVWQQWLTTVPNADTRPYVELAKFCEWQTGDVEQAAMWTQWALHEQEQGPGHARSQQVMGELRHRLARLQRKLQNGQSADSAQDLP